MRYRLLENVCTSLWVGPESRGSRLKECVVNRAVLMRLEHRRGLTDGKSLEGLRVAELALALSVDSCHSDLVRRVGLQARQHHRCWRERRGQRETCGNHVSGLFSSLISPPGQNMINHCGLIDRRALLLLCANQCGNPSQNSKWLLTWKITDVTAPGSYTWRHQRHDHGVGWCKQGLDTTVSLLSLTPALNWGGWGGITASPSRCALPHSWWKRLHLHNVSWSEAGAGFSAEQLLDLQCKHLIRNQRQQHWTANCVGLWSP